MLLQLERSRPPQSLAVWLLKVDPEWSAGAVRSPWLLKRGSLFAAPALQASPLRGARVPVTAGATGTFRADPLPMAHTRGDQRPCPSNGLVVGSQGSAERPSWEDAAFALLGSLLVPAQQTVRTCVRCPDCKREPNGRIAVQQHRHSEYQRHKLVLPEATPAGKAQAGPRCA